MTNATPNDAVNHPSHYTQYPVEVIELTRHMSFDRGNAVKYIARAGYKGGSDKEIEDIKKAIWYLNDDLKQLLAKKEASNQTGGSWDDQSHAQKGSLQDLLDQTPGNGTDADKLNDVFKRVEANSIPSVLSSTDVVLPNEAKG